MKRVLILWMGVCLACLSVHAKLSTGKTLTGSDNGIVFEDGKVYFVTNDVTLDANGTTGVNSPITVRNGTTAAIYVAKGKALTVKGRAASGTAKGYAGIRLEKGGMLYILGPGTVEATGGAPAAGTAGGNATGAVKKNSALYNYTLRNGAGGAGGAGGGGGGAGIGGDGGDAGMGGTLGRGGSTVVYTNAYGYLPLCSCGSHVLSYCDDIAGGAGGNGQDASGMGTLSLFGDILLVIGKNSDAAGGAAGTLSDGDDYESVSFSMIGDIRLKIEDSKEWAVAGGNGAGGGGGVPGRSIGSGGGGGGGGGAGSEGWIMATDNYDCFNPHPGKGGISENTTRAGQAATDNTSDASLTMTYVSGCTQMESGTAIHTTTTLTASDVAGGAGGSEGAYADNFEGLIVSSSARVSASSFDSTYSIVNDSDYKPSDLMYTVTFSNPNNLPIELPETMTLRLGDPMPNIGKITRTGSLNGASIIWRDTETQTIYYDANGSPYVSRYEVARDMTLEVNGKGIATGVTFTDNNTQETGSIQLGGLYEEGTSWGVDIAALILTNGANITLSGTDTTGHLVLRVYGEDTKLTLNGFSSTVMDNSSGGTGIIDIAPGAALDLTIGTGVVLDASNVDGWPAIFCPTGAAVTVTGTKTSRNFTFSSPDEKGELYFTATQLEKPFAWTLKVISGKNAAAIGGDASCCSGDITLDNIDIYAWSTGASLNVTFLCLVGMSNAARLKWRDAGRVTFKNYPLFLCGDGSNWSLRANVPRPHDEFGRPLHQMTICNGIFYLPMGRSNWTIPGWSYTKVWTKPNESKWE